MSKEETYELSNEGKKYLKEGLPEENLLNLVKKGPLDFSTAKEKVDNFNIALQWGKKNEWIKVNKGKIEIYKTPDTFETKKGLEFVSKGQEIKEELIKILVKRKLVKKVIKSDVDELIGKEVLELTPKLITTGIWKEVKFKPYNVKVPGKRIYPGKRQPYNQFLMNVRQKLVELGFQEMTGPAIEMEFWNFDALFQPQNHPARDWTQTYALIQPKVGNLEENQIVKQVKATHENGWETGGTGWGYEWSLEKASSLMPRAHDTAISPRYLSKGVKIPGKYFSIVRCYRPDVIDATHGVEFNQMGGFVIAKDLNFKNMLGILKEFAFEIAGAEDVKFHTDYYPFTEPSCQISIKHPELGWIEAAGAGIFRPELTEPLGIKEPVLAWGFGIDRLAMHALKINDIRHLFSRDLNWLRNQKIVR